VIFLFTSSGIVWQALRTLCGI